MMTAGPLMVAAAASRRFRLAGKLYLKGKRLSLPDNQFRDLKAAGLVEHAPAPRPRKSKSGATA